MLPVGAVTRVSVLLVSYMGYERIPHCLDRIEAATAGIDTETIVVANGVDLQDEHRAAETRGAVVLHSPVNLGFAGGLQFARAAARGEQLAIVQDDVLVDDGWLHPLLALLDQDPTVGAVGSRVQLLDGEPYGLGMFLDRDLRSHLLEDAPGEVSDWAVDACFSAACLVRASAWDGVGGPNHRLFPLWMVDTELCMRLYEGGWTVMVSQDSVARHGRHTSTTSWARRHLDERNQRIVNRDHRELRRGRRARLGSDDLESWIERCAIAAASRSKNPPPNPPPRQPVPFDQLASDARRDARSVQWGYRYFRARSAVGYRLRNAGRRR
jgi:GT2 family glycosyltransferase